MVQFGQTIDDTTSRENNKSREQFTPRPELDYGLADSEFRDKAAQPTQTPYHSLLAHLGQSPPPYSSRSKDTAETSDKKIRRKMNEHRRRWATKHGQCHDPHL